MNCNENNISKMQFIVMINFLIKDIGGNHFCLRFLLIMSFVWSYFAVSSEDDAIAVCTIFTNKIKRGNNPKSYSTTPLHRHLSAKHNVIYTAAKKTSAEKAGSSTGSPSAPKKIKLAAMKQSTMNDFKNFKPWGKDDPKTIMVNEKIINMIAIDNQPFSIVNDKGFIELLAHLEPRYLIPSRKYFNEVMLQQAYQNLTSDISKLLEKSSNFSFTTDMD